MGENARSGGQGWDQRILFAPFDTFSGRMRWVMLLAALALTVGWSAWLNGDLAAAWGLPDVPFYIDMAQGRMDLVPQPFSARPLAPLLARWIAAGLHCRVQGGFAVLAYGSLTWTAGVVYWLLLRTRAPRGVLLALGSVPFWPQLLTHAGLPDPLYAALVAGLLLALEQEWMIGAAVLMFPLMLARESTSLTLVCLLLVGWKRLRWVKCGMAVAGVALGSVVVQRLSAGGLPNPEGISGGLYLVGKVVDNLARSVGVNLWSNVYAEACLLPVWQTRLHIGPVHSVGVCGVSSVLPLQMLGVVVTTFGVLPLVWAMGWTRWRGLWRRADLTLRFCVLYGGASFALAPALGTWYVRLVGYGWPLLLVGAPRLVEGWDRTVDEGGEKRRWRATGAALLAMHLVVCGLGEGFLRGGRLAFAVGLEMAACALVLVQRRASERVTKPAGIQPSAW